MRCDFVSDIHGRIDRYEKLFKRVAADPPDALFIGGDFLPSPLGALMRRELSQATFIEGFLQTEFQKLKDLLGEAYPRVFLIMGNDDGRMEEATVREMAARGIWEYAHFQRIAWGEFTVYGYAYVPPTPFRLKDWERYDVSRYVEPGCLAPSEGIVTAEVSDYDLNFATIAEDLETLTGSDPLEKAIFLFHSPPYKCKLDRAALDGKMIDHVPLDPHIGSIAIQRFIEARRPLITLHGHVHESAGITGSWSDRFGDTVSFNAAHNGPELAVIRFDPYAPQPATRELL
ncbi:MAG: metallophosphoesterase family protein [Candidatus Omnitrophota bacterium]